MGLGPVYAATPILQRHGLGLDDLDAWEINEAFAAQVHRVPARVGRTRRSAATELGLPGALGTIDEDKLNVDGGAIALGHPVGASGTRIVLHVLNVLRRTGGKRGMAAICIGGGLGGAMLVETVDAKRSLEASVWERASTMQHWTIDARSRRPRARSSFDKAGADVNTLSADVLARAQRGARHARPRAAEGPHHPLGQGQRLHRRRRRRRVRRRSRTKRARSPSCAAAGTRSSGSPHVKYPTLALIRGFCLGGGLELALACRYRVVDRRAGHAARACPK